MREREIADFSVHPAVTERERAFAVEHGALADGGGLHRSQIRQHEKIEAFRAREYWTIEANFLTPAGAPFTARLTHLNGKKLDQFDLVIFDEASQVKTAHAIGALGRGMANIVVGDSNPVAQRFDPGASVIECYSIV